MLPHSSLSRSAIGSLDVKPSSEASSFLPPFFFVAGFLGILLQASLPGPLLTNPTAALLMLALGAAAAVAAAAAGFFLRRPLVPFCSAALRLMNSATNPETPEIVCMHQACGCQLYILFTQQCNGLV